MEGSDCGGKGCGVGEAGPPTRIHRDGGRGGQMELERDRVTAGDRKRLRERWREKQTERQTELRREEEKNIHLERFTKKRQHST